MRKRPEIIPPPSRKELFALRLMIITGIGSMGYLLFCLFDPAQIGYAPFYWLLMAAIVFNCLKILHEWYHYFYITVPPTPPLQKEFTVDIFTTFCAGEPYPMIVQTLEAIQAITYPHTAYLCDEADDPYLKEVCRRLGVKHVTRTDKKDAKAGNINNALRQSTGELCVVLDPDHVPEPCFLDPIVPHFSDEKVGFVQIVQAYSNLGETLIAKGAAQQTFQFYGPMMMCMNKYGTVLAIGANCTFRRTALESIGGHAPGLAEDMHTAMQLHAKGWKSVYVPAVLAKGLVPSTLSAYLKQQLKWARGTFELLVTTYPKLFRHFTWRQRLHYGTIPFHYFSGVIFLINFLVPILSLMLGLIPFRVDLLSFTMIGIPFVAATMLIRLFVQRWVMGEHERGFHVVGGLLLIGTWWVYILGLVYTIIRKKVPYIPTPKDDSDADNWSLNIPNIAIALLSLLAIVYGLSLDWNPYTWVMAGIAGINCAIMLFNIVASRRSDLLRIRERFDWIKAMLVYPIHVKKELWRFRHRLYLRIRRVALPLMLLVAAATFYFQVRDAAMPAVTNRPVTRQPVFYSGIFSPAASDGLTSMELVRDYQQQYKTHFNIISLYVPWGDEARCEVPEQLVQDIYRNGSYPMITWEPWAGLFEEARRNPLLQQEQKIFAHIVNGAFDHYLERFAQQVKSLNRPVYIRFAHEPDNPAYPWSPAGNNTPEEFRNAWRYVHHFFKERGAYNAVWVWNPWKPDAVDDYFPGEDWVDWIGVTNLNYGALNDDGNWYAFWQLYEPFHRKRIFRSGLPVMLAEMGSLVSEGQQEAWLKDAFRAIDEDFPEIKAFVLFNTDRDTNVPRRAGEYTLNWKLRDPEVIFTVIKQYQSGNDSPAQPVKPLPLATVPALPEKASLQWMDTIRGINYHKGENWFRNFHTLTRREIRADMSAMQQLGVNTIKRFGPGVYDRNILAVAEELNMQLYYGFWVPEIKDITTDREMLSSLEDEILATVKKLRHNKHIIAWNIGNTVWQGLGDRFYKPVLLYQQAGYLAWLKGLVYGIRQLDPHRPITMDLKITADLAGTIDFLRQELPGVSAFGLTPGKDSNALARLPALKAPCFISQASVKQYLQLPDTRRGVFIDAWQDQETRDYVTFNGLTDHWGRYKQDYYQLGRRWKKIAASPALPVVKILRPARTTNPGNKLTYHALVQQQGQWTLAAHARAKLEYEWHLVKTDSWGYPVFMKRLGKGTDITVSIPEQPSQYKLYLTAAGGNDVVTAQSELNTPLQ